MTTETIEVAVNSYKPIINYRDDAHVKQISYNGKGISFHVCGGIFANIDVMVELDNEFLCKLVNNGCTELRIRSGQYKLVPYWACSVKGIPTYISGKVGYIKQTNYTEIFKLSGYYGNGNLECYEDVSLVELKNKLAQFKRIGISPAIPNDLFVRDGTRMVTLKEVILANKFLETLLSI